MKIQKLLESKTKPKDIVSFLILESDYRNSPIDKHLQQVVPNLSKEQAYKIIETVRGTFPDLSPLSSGYYLEDKKFTISNFGNSIVELYFQLKDGTISKSYERRFQSLIKSLKGLDWVKRVAWESSPDTATIIIHI